MVEFVFPHSEVANCGLDALDFFLDEIISCYLVILEVVDGVVSYRAGEVTFDSRIVDKTVDVDELVSLRCLRAALILCLFGPHFELLVVDEDFVLDGTKLVNYGDEIELLEALLHVQF